MGFSPLATMARRIPSGGRQSPRNTKITGFGLHHNAGVDSIGEATNPSREVSANYWIVNAGLLIPNIDEIYRAWTSGMAGYPAGAAADRRNITFEVSNTPRGVKEKTWEVSNESLAMLANSMGEISSRLKLGPVKRSSISGVGVHKDWVPTSCPGPYMMKYLADIIRLAEGVRVSYEKNKRKLITPKDFAKITGSESKPAPAPKPKPKPNGKAWPYVALPINGERTTAYHNAWVKLLSDVGYKDKSLTVAMQKWLKDHGFYAGFVDGDFGPMTIDALQRFLKAKGLYTGELDAYRRPYAQARGAMLVSAEKKYLNSQMQYYD